MSPPAQSSRKAWAAWGVLAVLMLASIVSFVDRQVVAIVVEPMKADLEISDSQIGWLYGVFAIFYAAAAWPIAVLADRKPRKYIIAIGIFFWSVMTVLCGLSKHYTQVLLARIGVGVGEASLGPATVSMVGDLFPREQITLALSIFQTAAVMGSGIAFVIGGVVLSIVQSAEPMVLPLVGELAPWQQTFVIVGVPGLALAVVFLFLREPVRRTAMPKHGSRPELLRFYRENGKAIALHHLGFLAYALMGYAFVFWSVPYFGRVHGVPAAEAAQVFGWIFFLTGPIGPVCAALFARHLTNKGRADGNIVAGLLAGAIAVPLIVLIQYAPSPGWAYLLYVPAMIFINAPFGLANGALPVIAPSVIHAQVAAIYLFVVSVGNLLGPPVAGFFNEVVFPETDGVRYSIISLAVIFGGIGAVLLQLARRPYADAWRTAQTVSTAA